MSGKTVDSEARRKRVLWRANHRGIKEMDLILGGFAAARIGSMTPAELDRFEALLEVPDQQFLAWMTGTEPVPAAMRCKLLESILLFRA
jgi:antitoxin CptB